MNRRADDFILRKRLFSRRSLLLGAASSGGALLLGGAGTGRERGTAKADGGFGFDQVRLRAAALASRPYVPPDETMPAVLRDMSYDEYRAIRFRPSEALWADRDGFKAQFFHRGFLYRRQVRVSVVEDGVATPVAYRPDMFDLGGLDVPDVPDLGFAGLRLHHPAGGGSTGDEFAVFLGASYFRLIARGQEYGLSGRGVAVNTGGSEPEEFPDFTEFWIERPGAGAEEIAVLALLDGPSMAGAFRFRLRPGDTTAARIDASLVLRRPVGQLGLAPLTSMFLHGEHGPAGFDDFRPEMHDSDGLLMRDGAGEWSWRPLANGRPAPLATGYPMAGPGGFGLMQRDRDFASYLDVQAMHERRPSFWVEPRGDWGRGVLELYEFPSLEEYNDNIVASWVPGRAPEPGRPLDFGYDLTVIDGGTGLHPLGRVTGTRIGSAERLRPTVPPSPERRFFVVDFEGDGLPGHGADLAADVTASAGAVVEPVVEHVPQTGGWRLYFEYRPGGGGPAELAARLMRGDRVMTETWRFTW
ncbi:glucan biosynthesis protein G [Skermanella sp. TT6]|uniref:Glucan biosynthesis protein G n=1 Tax=Skermanella cutis TaxID=2775420 RepID=A0ABX7BA84_9PROT|nr:glucan biosynthesis protein G [Skermanella sp. TT6]QQP90525.1 glucan biosynthesis protein G [Skermanella sp. TT6]